MKNQKKPRLVRGLRFEDLLRYPENQCRICKEVLTEENWSQSQRKKKSYICKVCASLISKQYRKRRREKDDKEHDFRAV